jgi:hypothetical protein
LFFTDFSAILIYGHRPKGLLEILFAMLVHWGFEAAGGVAFVFLLKSHLAKEYTPKRVVFWHRHLVFRLYRYLTL